MITTSVKETRALGARLAASLRPGDVLLLFGDMGAGNERVDPRHSQWIGDCRAYCQPRSFTILQVYEDGRIPLYHFDWYRMESVEELYELGMEEYLGGDGVAVIEWPTRCPEAIPESYLEVVLKPAGENLREISWRSAGNFRTIPQEV